MKQSTLILIAFIVGSLLFLGCGPRAFIIKPTESKFDAPKEPIGFVGRHNRLTNKSTAGGTHLDYRGIYLNPVVLKDRQSDEIVSLGFYFEHISYEPRDGFRPIKEIILLTDAQERVCLKFSRFDSDYDIGNWNTTSKEYIGSYWESSTSTVSKSDFLNLSRSNSLEAKLIGGKRNMIVERERIEKGFISNIKQFYELHVK